MSMVRSRGQVVSQGGTSERGRFVEPGSRESGGREDEWVEVT